MSTIILQHSLRHQNHKILDVAQKATDGRFRLVDCKAFLDCSILRVKEFSFDDIHHLSYAAISYPWKGVATTHQIQPTFDVEGAHGDPISVDVIRDACTAACGGGTKYIWLDRLCVLQTRSADKHTQIEHMHEVYRCCKLCIVIPGGLQRLVRLDEETPWICRSWTLQESLSPPKVVVLFAWSLGSGNIRVHNKSVLGRVEEVIPGRSATASLQNLVDTSSEGYVGFFRGDPAGILEDATCVITSSIFRGGSPHAKALAVAMLKECPQDCRDNAIWQCAQLRTSSRPVDMVFSIMGMFGVTLAVKNYEPDDRLHATKDLAKEILKQGRSASWLGVAFRLPPCKYISTSPLFPWTHVAGEASVQTPSGRHVISKFIAGECLMLDSLIVSQRLKTGGAKDSTNVRRGYLNAPAAQGSKVEDLNGPQAKLLPRGSMDDEGYLEIEALSLPVRPNPGYKGTRLWGSNSQCWEACGLRDQNNHEIVHFAIFLGMYKEYQPSVHESSPTQILDFAKFMIVARHDANLQRFHTVTFGRMLSVDPFVKLQWTSRKFRIGGPKPLPKPRSRIEEQVVDYEPQLAKEQPIGTFGLLQSNGRNAACSQEEVEKFFRSHPKAGRYTRPVGDHQKSKGVGLVAAKQLPNDLGQRLNRIVATANDDDTEDGSSDNPDGAEDGSSDNSDDVEDGSSDNLDGTENGSSDDSDGVEDGSFDDSDGAELSM